MDEEDDKMDKDSLIFFIIGFMVFLLLVAIINLNPGVFPFLNSNQVQKTEHIRETAEH